MNNRLKEFEELLLNNTLLKVQNQALGYRNPKWKEWWQTIHEFIEEHIQNNMELARFNEQSYQLEMHAYRIVFLNFKYDPPPHPPLASFVYVEIGTSSRVLAMPSMVQPVAITKLVSPLRGGTSCKIIPLPIQHVPFTIVVSKLVENSKRFDKEHVEPINLSFTILDNISKSLEFLYGSLPLTPH
jgi:hypothetical protein